MLILLIAMTIFLYVILPKLRYWTLVVAISLVSLSLCPLLLIPLIFSKSLDWSSSYEKP